MNITGFMRAKPIWFLGREKEVNLTVGFKCSFNLQKDKEYVLVITGSTLYRICLNSTFVHYGPARGPHGYARVDRVNLNKYLSEGKNTLSVEVAGYNCNSFYTLNIPSFIQAEIMENNQVIGYTDKQGDFSAIELTSRVQNAMRYSSQRSFTEIYHLDHSDKLTNWANEAIVSQEEFDIIPLDIKYLPRDLPMPKYEIANVRFIVESGVGKKSTQKQDTTYLTHRFINNISDEITGYTLEEIEERPFEVIQDITFEATRKQNRVFPEVTMTETIHQGQYILFDLGINNNGFILADIIANKDSEVYFIYDEKLINDKIDIQTWDFINILKYSLKKSEKVYQLQSFESYGYRYIMCYVDKGSITLNKLGLREYSYPTYNNTQFKCSDEKINVIFKAAVETYRQNTLDVFMDCPTRERAGWLCDSYFTAQAAQFFSGNTTVEKIFLENFILAREFPHTPKGMLPMCYPSEHANGRFIPQWAMWYVIELEGYYKRNPKAKKETFKDLCYNLVNYFLQFINEDGLLEKLDGWNFIEWSEANNWVHDVNYPTNMLYSRMLKLIGTWYKDEELINKSQQIKSTIIQQSFDGKFFIDNAIRMEDGYLKVTGNKSEVCQYYAFFFGVADETHMQFWDLKDMLLNVFDPDRKDKNIIPEVAYANAFIGYYLRMELLLKWRRYQQVIDELKCYFYKMAVTTGTLWEFDEPTGSLNHGFASFAGVAVIRALLGIQEINETEKYIKLDFENINMEAEVRVGTSLGYVTVKRELQNGNYAIDYDIPIGFKLKKEDV
jgi:alpha-L-rhamnosidase